MNKLNVGDYVRTSKGIAKIIDKLDNERMSYPGAWRTDIYLEIYDDTEYIYNEDVIKSSPNIIDLIEVGDYVNGYKVLRIEKDYLFDYREEINVLIVQNDEVYEVAKKIYSDEIKSIVTKESFENISYKVGE